MTIPADFHFLKKGDRVMIIDGLAGSSTVCTVENIHHDEECIVWLDKSGETQFALFEEILKKL